MENQLATTESNTDLAQLMQELGVSNTVTDEAFDALAGGDYLPRLQLYGSNSEASKLGIIQQGHYGIVTAKDVVIDLGVKANIVVLSMRLKAMQIGEQVLSYYDQNSAEFQKIMVESKDTQSGNLCGPEFLLWIPSHQKFCTFYMCSKTMRRQAPKVRAFLGQSCTLGVTLLKNKKFSWHGPTIDPCSTPLTPPDMGRARIEINKFNNPESSSVEAVTPEVDRDR